MVSVSTKHGFSDVIGDHVMWVCPSDRVVAMWSFGLIIFSSIGVFINIIIINITIDINNLRFGKY